MSSKKKHTVLIIDDDETVKEALNVLLTDEGFTVYNLASGHNVPTWLDNHHPDIILIDYLMPGQTGAEVTRYIRSRSDTAKLPIIMLAATPSYKKYAYEAGIDVFIVKPFDIDYLLRQISHFLD